MPNQNLFNGMMGRPDMIQGQQGGPPQQVGGMQGPAKMPGPAPQQQGPNDRAQFFQSQFDIRNAGPDPRELQSQYDRVASQLAMAQASGAPPSAMVQMQSQLQALQRQIQWAQEDRARSGNAQLLEQQLQRELGIGGGPVGGRSTNQGRRFSLEDAILANSLGIGGGGRGRR